MRRMHKEALELQGQSKVNVVAVPSSPPPRRRPCIEELASHKFGKAWLPYLRDALAAIEPLLQKQGDLVLPRDPRHLFRAFHALPPGRVRGIIVGRAPLDHPFGSEELQGSGLALADWGGAHRDALLKAIGTDDAVPLWHRVEKWAAQGILPLNWRLSDADVWKPLHAAIAAAFPRVQIGRAHV